MACKFSSQTLMFSLDDKCTSPLGEPGPPQSTAVKSHNSSLGVVGSTNVSLNNSFHIVGVVPSVCMVICVPENYRSSYHTGNDNVTVKDKVFQPSTAMRPTEQTVKIIRKYKSVDDVNSTLSYPVEIF